MNINLKRFVILASLILSSYYSFAEGIKVVVYEETENFVIPNVICKIYDAKNVFVSFMTSDAAGEIVMKEESASLIIFSLLGYENLTVDYKSLKEDVVNKIYLKPAIQALSEIVVKAPPIRQKNDTLIYNVGSFVDAQDKYIEDILKKLPGISVGENGNISFQGKAISKFYIEGQDLLGNNYNQATRNLPVESVSQIELMENNQNIRALKGKIFEDKAALNIKLNKDFKLRPFGEIQLGGGLSPNVYDNKLFLTNVGVNNQMLITAKMNNSGTDLSTENKEHIDVSNLDFYEPLPLSITRTSTLLTYSLPKEKFLFNHAYSWGINNLFKINEASHLRVNILGYFDRQSQNSVFNNQYGGSFPFYLIEKNKAKEQIQTYTPIISYELNANQLFIINESRGSFSILNQGRDIVSNEKLINQNIYNKPTFFQNSLSITYPGSILIYQIKSFVRYYDNSENLTVLNNSNDTIQLNELKYSTKTFQTKNKISTTLPLGKHSLDINFLINYKKNDWALNNDNSLKRDCPQNEELSMILSSGLYYKYSNKGKLKIEIPITYNSIGIHLTESKDNKYRFVTASPSLSINQELNQWFALRFLMSMNKYNESDLFYSEMPYWVDYRTKYYGFSENYSRKTFRSTLSLNYKDLSSMFFSNITISYSTTKKPYLKNYIYQNDFTEIAPTLFQNASRILYANFTADKSFINNGISIKLSLDYNAYNYWIMQNAMATDNKSNTAAASFNVIYQQLKWLKMVMTINGSINWQNNNYKSSALANVKNDISMFLFLSTKWNINLYYNNYLNELQPDQFKHFNLANLEAQYKVLKQLNLNFRLNNILNNNIYSISFYNGLNFQSRSIPVRGREYLFSVIYKF